MCFDIEVDEKDPENHSDCKSISPLWSINLEDIKAPSVLKLKTD